MDTRIQIEGLAELARNLRRLDAELPKRLRVIHNEVVAPVASRAQARAPRRSGELAGTIRPLSTQKVARVAAGSGRVRYAGPIHYGWPARGITAQPFLIDAFTASASVMVSDYHRRLGDFLDEVWAR